mmetsp:Transcript_15719/g.33484  ORF Transcript_15719/g.33484 Transcript_15719/m.33484 type:complete len:379 (+) Transcript_15719:13-1149(+)
MLHLQLQMTPSPESSPVRAGSSVARTNYYVLISAIIIFAEGQSLMENDVGSDHDLHWLPKSSAEFFSSSSCSDDVTIYDVEHDSFINSILAGRHTAWGTGWEMTPPDGEFCQQDSGFCESKSYEETSKGYYVRVSDLLNTAMQHNDLPVQIDISNVCHKGMEAEYQYLGIPLSGDGKSNLRENNNFSNIPSKPNPFIPSETWSSLWNTCTKKLLSNERVSSACIDVPGILIENAKKSLQSNNPCRLDYRMVDGSHRLCLRKYILNLLEGELLDLKQQLVEYERKTADEQEFRKNLQFRIMNKQQLLDQTSKGYFFVLNQTTFEKLLTNMDPQATWAKSQAILMRELTVEFKLKWEQWMKRAMDHIEALKTAESRAVNM